MKNMTRGILLLSVAFATSVGHAGQPAPAGVAGVDVFVKQMPAKRSVTDARGNFALDGLAPGSYTLAFRARAAKDLTRTPSPRTAKNPTDTLAVASSYSIKIEGTKRAMSQSGVTNDSLTAGVNVAIEVGAGSRVRGQVLATAGKRMVWIAQELGSHMSGHWAEADSAEARSRRAIVHSGDDLRDLKGNANQVDPKDPRNENNDLHAPR